MASPIGQAALVHVLQNSAVGAAVAGAGNVLGAVEQHLHGRQEVADSVVLHEFEAIGDGGDGAVSPARAAILRDVLVEISGAVVDSADVAPRKVVWKVSAADVILGLRCGDNLLQRVAGRLINFGVEEPVGWPQSSGGGAGGESQEQGNCETHAKY